MEIVFYLVIAIVAFGLGIVTGRYLLRQLLKQQEVAAQGKVKKILREAENNAEILKKNKLLEAKEKFLQMKADHEQEINQKNNVIAQRENTLKQKEQSLNQKLENQSKKEQELENQRNAFLGTPDGWKQKSRAEMGEMPNCYSCSHLSELSKAIRSQRK